MYPWFIIRRSEPVSPLLAVAPGVLLCYFVKFWLSALLLSAAPMQRATPPLTAQTTPAGLLETKTLFSVYGRGFGVAPILGKLGAYKDINAMTEDVQPWVSQIAAVNGGKGVAVGIHLIYALAVPCTAKGVCLDYLNGAMVQKYIAAAAERGWVVVLDTQLGRSDPVKQVTRMIDAGYLKYDNVHVALDPEFHSIDGHDNPGVPVGTVTAAQINQVEQILDRYVTSQNLATKKILIVHQFGDPMVHDGAPYMIQAKKTLKDFDNVELVIDADGLGTRAIKVRKYDLMTSAKAYPFLRFRGIKIFFPNRWEKRGHFDKPPLTVDEIFGVKPVSRNLRVAPPPDVVIIA